MSLVAAFRQNLKAAIDNDPRPFAAIARRSGYSESYIREVLAGRRRGNPTLTFVDTLAQTLGINATDMFHASVSQEH